MQLISRQRLFLSAQYLLAVLVILLFALVVAAEDRRVLIIGLDGFRADAMEQAKMPNTHALYKDGAGFYSRGFNESFTVSAPNWTSVLHGIHCDRHGIYDNAVYDGKDFSAYPNLIYRLKEHNPALNTAAIYTWDYLNYNLANPDGVDYRVLHNMLDPKGVEGVDWQSDDKVAAAMADHLTRGNPHVALLYLGMPDIIGHRGGFFPTTERYMGQLEKTDQHIGRVLSALRSRPGVKSGAEQWLVLITTDHAGKQSHVTNEYKIREIPFIMNGPGVSPQQPAILPRNVDVCRTVLTYMGVPEEAQQGLDGHVIGLAPPVERKPGYDRNLLVNGDGEYDRGFDSQKMDQAIGGWEDQQHHPDNGFETMTLLRYGAPEGFPTLEDAGPVDRGRNFFIGGSQGQLSRMTQQLELTDLQEAIDADQVDFTPSGWLGGFINQNDHSELLATFEGARKEELGCVKVTGPTNVERNNVTSLQFREFNGKVPPGTRTVVVELRAICETGVNDGYADNLSFVLTRRDR